MPITQRPAVVHHRSQQTRPAHRLASSFIAHVFALAALLGGWATASSASPSAAELVQAELIAEPAAIRPGEPFWVGLRLRIKQHWHVYWRNPGDSGEAVSINWRLPPGFSASPSLGRRRSASPSPFVNFGYEGETTLLARITPPAALTSPTPIDILADVTWLVCEKECIPGEASLSLSLPVAGAGAAAAPAATATASFDAARRALPQPSPWGARMQLAPDRVTLAVDAKGLTPGTIRSAFFFPYAETLVRHAAPQQLDVTRDGLVLRLERSALSTAAPTDAGGVLVVEEALGATTAVQAFDLANVTIGQEPHLTRLHRSRPFCSRILALIGGVILNLMPCVFPVLSIKVLALVEQAGGSRSQVRRHGAAYTAGVLVAFTALGSVLLGARAAGAEVGWGFQLQSPAAVALLAYLQLAMGLSLSGVFHLGSSLQGLGHGLTRRSGLAGSFFTGALAAVVARLHGAVHGDGGRLRPHPASRPVARRDPGARLGLALPFLL
jgi:thiol:disulfide interchange protein DsbD